MSFLAKERHYGEPLTDEERQRRHAEEFGEWREIDDLPPRGIGLVEGSGLMGRRIPPPDGVGVAAPAPVKAPSLRDIAIIKDLAVGTYTSIETIYGPAEAPAGSRVSLEIVVKNRYSTGIYIAVTGVFDSSQLAITPEYAAVAAGASYSFTTSFTMPNKNITVTVYSFYWSSPNWIEDDHKSVSIKLTAVEQGWQLLGTVKTVAVKHAVPPEQGWQLLGTVKTVAVKQAAPPQVGWQLLHTREVTATAGELPAKWELQYSYTDPHAYFYKGPAQTAVAQYTSPPEEFPWTDDIAERAINKIKSELGGQAEVLGFRVYMDKAGPLWSKWRVEVDATGQLGTEGVGFAWYPIIMASLIIAGAVIILLLVIKILNIIYKPQKLDEDIKKKWSRGTLESMTSELDPSYTPEVMAGMSDQELRDVLDDIYSEQVGAGISWVPIAIIGGIAVAGTAIGVSAAKHFIPAKTKEKPKAAEAKQGGK